MTEGFVRRPTCIEALYMDIDDCGYNMTFCYLLKLDKEPLPSELDKAFKQTVAARSGINLKYRNYMWFKSDFLPECIVKTLDSNDIADYKITRINYRVHTAMLSVLRLKDKDDCFLCFEFFHGAVDGRCALDFIYDFFAVLNGTTLKESTFSVVDMDIVAQNEDNKQKAPFFPLCSLERPQGVSTGKETRLRLKTDATPLFMSSKLSNAIAQCFTVDKALMMIPVDIRKYAEAGDKQLFGNFVLPLFVDASKSKTLSELQDEISKKVNSKSAISTSVAKFINYNAHPKRFRKAMLESLFSLAAEGEKFPICALVSSIGTVKAELLKADCFAVEDVDVFFDPMPFLGFVAVAVKFNGCTNTSLSWHSGKVPREVAEEALTNIENNILHSK